MKLSKILELFKEESCDNKIEYELTKTECPDNTVFWSFTIYYYTNKWSIAHSHPNELEIVIDNNKKIMGIEFSSGGDRCSRTIAWKSVCKCVADDLVFEIDLKEEKL